MTLAARRYAAGFTLIEAIVAIVITGILAGIVAVFIAKPVQGYADSVRRAELTDTADVALRRMTRDVRLALPNSLRLKDSANATVTTCAVGTTCYIEFIMTKAGGRYRDPADGSTGGNFLSFTDTADVSFDVLGTMPISPAIVSNDFVVVYNLGAGADPANAYLRDTAQCDATPVSPGCNIAKVSGVAGNVLTLDANPFAFQSPPLSSPDSRFQVVGQNDKVVRYGCVGGALTRSAGCDFTTTTTCATSAVLAGSATAEPKATCDLEYQAGATRRNGLLYVRLTLTDTPSGESATLVQQIHVDNAP